MMSRDSRGGEWPGRGAQITELDEENDMDDETQTPDPSATGEITVRRDEASNGDEETTRPPTQSPDPPPSGWQRLRAALRKLVTWVVGTGLVIATVLFVAWSVNRLHESRVVELMMLTVFGESEEVIDTDTWPAADEPIDPEPEPEPTEVEDMHPEPTVALGQPDIAVPDEPEPEAEPPVEEPVAEPPTPAPAPEPKAEAQPMSCTWYDHPDITGERHDRKDDKFILECDGRIFLAGKSIDIDPSEMVQYQHTDLVEVDPDTLEPLGP